MKKKKGFTLLELLVVVLIIGILAAIALPQYQAVVGRARFSTLKNFTRSVQQSADRYYLAYNAYPLAMSGLDIDLNIETDAVRNWGYEFTTKEGITCTIWKDPPDEGRQPYVACWKKIFGKDTYYYVNRDTGHPVACLSLETTPTHPASRMCAKETNKPLVSGCLDNVCVYWY